jgi:hypothetical protein
MVVSALHLASMAPCAGVMSANKQALRWRPTYEAVWNSYHLNLGSGQAKSCSCCRMKEVIPAGLPRGYSLNGQRE